MKKWTESRVFKLDHRTAQDIRDEIAKLAEAYTPEWHFQEENPDIGSVLGLLFAKQAEWNLGKFNRKMEQFRMDFVNMLGLSLLPAHPAKACVLFEKAPEGFCGTFLKKGTKLSAEGEGTNIVFETNAGCYITASRLTHCFEAEGMTGVTVPLFGEFTCQDYLEKGNLANQKEFSGKELFSFPRKGIEKSALMLGHEHIFDPANDKVYLKLIGKENLGERILEGEFRILYPAQEGFLEAEEVKLLSNTLMIGRDRPTGSKLVIEAVKPPKDNIVLDEILVSSAGAAHEAAYVGNGTVDFEVEKFAPFRDALQLFEECYIGDDTYFSKENAVIFLHFHVSFLMHTVGLAPKEAEMENLRLIKKKPPMPVKIVPADTFAEEISLEYFNGKGWRRLACQQDYKRMFASSQSGDYALSFLCPKDFHPSQVGAYEGRCIRMRLMKAENCYMLPCNHTYPVLEHLKISYSYEGKYERPHCVERIYGTKRKNLTAELAAEKPVLVFAPSKYKQNVMYLGFEKKFEQSPVNLYFEFRHYTGCSGRKLIFEYSTSYGFRELRVLDGTDGFAHTGIVSVMAPEDFARTEEEGIYRYWLRITDRDGCFHQKTMCRPFLNQVRTNGVWVQNIESLEEEEFYLEEIRPDMSFGLSENYILDADIWVNEKDCYSQPQMAALLQEMPGKVRAEYDISGNIQNFYVKWEETKDFAKSGPQDRHYILDRARNELRFGDGVHVKIPGVTGDVSFCAAVRVCDGARGNVPAGVIRNFVSKVSFYGECYNPLPSFGGTSQETVSKALERGASQFSSRRRILTQLDYIREIKAYSDNIDKVSCVVGKNPKGEKEPGHICLVVLMKDFTEEPGSFIREAEGIRKYLYSRCEMSIREEKLSVVAPVPIEISVELWVKKEQWEESFEVQNKLVQVLQDFLEPVSDAFHAGWEIGELPKRSQILMCLRGASCTAKVKYIMITGKYLDKAGVCEMELDKIPKSLFFICKNGQHKVHILP